MYKKIFKSLLLLVTLAFFFTALIVLSSNYTFFNIRLKNETQNLTTVIAGLLNSNGNDTSALSNYGEIEDFRVTLYSSDKELLFDNVSSSEENSFHDSEALKIAEKNGIGETSGHFSFSGKNTYSYALRLKNGSFIQVSGTSSPGNEIFTSLIIPLIFMFILLYVLCIILSWFITENITKPINKISLTDFDNPANAEVYPELRPLMNKIKAQNNEIERQIVKSETRKTRFQTVSENINEGLLTLDADLNVLSMNASAEKIFGMSEESTIHSPFAAIAPDNSLISALQAAKDGHNGFVLTSVGEKNFHAFYSPVSEHNVVCGIVLLLLDITERVKAENIRREFTANVSHELKTPLTTILGYSQIINNGIAKPEDIVGFSQKIEKEATRLITLIDDIIKLSHLDEGKTVGESQPVHISAVVDDVIDRLRINAKQKRIVLDASGDDFTVFGNSVQLFELVYNLCDNAIKYTPDNGSVSVITGNRFVKVCDTGIGIPEEYHERIFERFFRVDKSRSKSVNGTGLGLSIVKHIAEQYNAQISVVSAPDKGTSITVSFD